MSEIKRPKYIIASTITFKEFQDELNRIAAEGYGLAFTMERPDHLTGIMKLKDEQMQLSEAVDVINVDITAQENGEIARRISEGWIIISNYSKHVTMMKRTCPGATQL